MGQPIFTKSLGLNEKYNLQEQVEVYGLNINSDTETISVRFRHVLMSPATQDAPSLPVQTLKDGAYTRFNSKKGTNASLAFMQVTKDNLKFDDLRNSQVGQMIMGMIANDFTSYPAESLEQKIYTDPQPEETQP